MIDLVPCHTSDQHPWFQEARSSRDNPKRDYYVWRDGQNGNEPNNWRSLSGGSSWEFDEQTNQFYLHSFLKTQPDLNWDNPAVRDEMKNVVRFWFDMGVDGMRVDAIWGISKDPEFGDDSPNPDFYGDPEAYGAFIHDHCTGQKIENYLRAAGSARPFFCVGNHDQPRVRSRLGFERARALQFLNLLCPGVSVIYYGDEIGMTNGELTADDIHDNFSPANSAIDSRDLERTPMQWDDTQFAGFSDVKTWLPVNKNRTFINVTEEKKNSYSILNLHRNLLQLRKDMPIFRDGSLEIIHSTGNGYILGIKRELDNERAYIFINFADAPQSFFIPEDAEIITSTHSLDLIFKEKNNLTIPGYCGILLIK